MEKIESVGFIGLGIMGAPMARHLRAAGYRVRVWNRDRRKALPLEALGCALAGAPRDLAECDATVAMVTGPEALDEVLGGPAGWFAGGPRGRLLVNMSTVSIACTLSLAERCRAAGSRFLDCPVAGSKAQVEAAQLIVLAGGEEADLALAEPMLLKMGKAVVRAGAAGQGTALKLCMNLIVAQMTTALTESVTLARTLQVDPARVFDVLKASPALDCGYFRIKEKALLAPDYSPAFPLKHMLKDVRFMLAEAGARGAALPVTEAVEVLMARALAAGEGDRDLCVIAETLKI
ncbi:MAG: NAD(P)-dependent oxidoreductase [Elusimicrobiota bacterium]|jgi:3-hydroxyisobutyrate dehydrogenase-like beta-hydroxyacid dehydrogenase